MKNKRGIIILVVLLAIGFAAVSTTLVINGVIGLSFGELDVYYSKAVINGTEDNTVIKDKTHIEFDTTMTLVGEKYEMDYDVTNGSRNYDADIKMECNYETEDGGEYLALENKINTDSLLRAMTTRTGHLTIKMIKAVTEPKDIHITCELKATPQERDEDPGDEITKEAVTLVETIMSKANEDSIQEYASGNKGEVYAFSHDETEQMKANTDYRYIGDAPNNYITYNDELWRVIGVFEDENGVKRAKIMRNESLGYNTFGSTSDFNTSTIKDILINSINDEAYEQIDSVNYYIGATSAPNVSADSFYTNERSQTLSSGNSNYSYKGKVGLLYVSDYYYTYGHGISDTCFSNPNSCISNNTEANVNNSWMFKEKYLWTMDTYTSSNQPVYYVNSSGSLNLSGAMSSEESFPVVYLQADIIHSDGDGTSDYPYVIESKNKPVTNIGGTMMAYSYNTAFWNYSKNITKVVFENTLTTHETTDDLIFDVSAKNNGSVMAYLVPNDDTLNSTWGLNGSTPYTLYINANGEIGANKDSSNLFGYFSNLLTVENLEYFNTSRATNMGYMFAGCNNLTTLDLSSFNTSNVEDMQDMFNGCSKLTLLNINSFDTSHVTDMNDMFNSCEKLTVLDLSNFDTSSVKDMNYMFKGCNNLTTLNINSFDTSNVTDMHKMFSYCEKLTTLELSNFDTTKVLTMDSMFEYCKSLEDINVSSFSTSNVGNMRFMFYYCEKLKKLNLNNFDTSSVIDMSKMFTGCSNLTELKVDNFNTSAVVDMGNMFNGCTSLTVLDLSSFNTANVNNMGYMFAGSNNLQNLNLSNFDTSSVDNMRGMFSMCEGLETLNISNFNTSNVTNMALMFYHCAKLVELDASSFNTVNVTDMQEMFNSCSSLVTLDISNFDVTKVTSKSYIFGAVPKDTIVKVKNSSVQSWVLTNRNNYSITSQEWTTNNVVIKG